MFKVGDRVRVQSRDGIEPWFRGMEGTAVAVDRKHVSIQLPGAGPFAFTADELDNLEVPDTYSATSAELDALRAELMPGIPWQDIEDISPVEKTV